MNDPLEQFAQKVSQNLLPKEQKVMIDPMSAIMIASLIVSTLRLILGVSNRYCPTEEQKMRVAKKPGIFARLLVKWQIKRAFRKSKNELVTHISPAQLEEAIWQTVQSSSDEELISFFRSL